MSSARAYAGTCSLTYSFTT